MSNHSLMNHILEHNGLQPYKCDECPYEAGLKHALDLHKKSKHPNNVRKAGSIEASNVCHICGKEVNLIRPGAMQEHLRNHRSAISLHCSYVACGILFSTIEEKRKHERSVHKTKEHCDKCGKVFIGNGYLKSHIKSVHERKSLDLKCTFPECDKVFTNRSNRTWHINTIHFPNKYKCEICNKTCGNLDQLKDHGLIHNDERSFQCKDCDQKFRRRGLLIDHKRKHEKSVHKQKPYACQHCPYRGASSSLLWHHKKQKHKAEFEDEKKEKEKAKIKISPDMPSGKNEGNEKIS